MIDTDNLVGNEESITNNVSAATVSKNTHVDTQVSSNKMTHQSSNICKHLFAYFTNKKSVQQKIKLRQDRKIANAILASNINIIYKNM